MSLADYFRRPTQIWRPLPRCSAEGCRNAPAWGLTRCPDHFVCCRDCTRSWFGSREAA